MSVKNTKSNCPPRKDKKKPINNIVRNAMPNRKGLVCLHNCVVAMCDLDLTTRIPTKNRDDETPKLFNTSLILSTRLHRKYDILSVLFFALLFCTSLNFSPFFKLFWLFKDIFSKMLWCKYRLILSINNWVHIKLIINSFCSYNYWTWNYKCSEYEKQWKTFTHL